MYIFVFSVKDFLYIKTMEEITKGKNRFGFINFLNFCKSKHHKQK